METKSHLLVEANPAYKKVPVLIHNGRPICESLTILEYIDAVWKVDDLSLMPSDPYMQSQARFRADFVGKKLDESGKMIWLNEGEEQEKAKVKFIESLKLLENELGGQKMGFLDITLVSHYSWFYTIKKCGNFTIEADCPKLVQWAKRCMEIDSVAKSLPDQEKIHELVLTVRKKRDL